MNQHFDVARELAARYAALDAVEAVAVAGSLAAGVADPTSDIDLYVYTRADLTPRQRADVVASDSDPAAIDNSFWGPGDTWRDAATGIEIDVMFFAASWIEDQLDRVLVRHEASVGYSTCFWHTIRVSRRLFDRAGWFAALQQRAAQPYPEELVRAIIAGNEPILRRTNASYLHQIEKAIARDDVLSINHRVAAFLASYFDILFALNRMTHPGEKRLLDIVEASCARLPRDLRGGVSGLIRAIPAADSHILAHVNLLVDGLDVLLAAE